MSSTQNVRHPPPTAHMPGSNLLIFWREAPQWDLLRGIGAIFEFRTMSGGMGVQSPNSRLFSDPRLELILLLKSTVSRILGRNLKIAPMPLNGCLRGVSRQNRSKFDPAVLAVGGGAVRFECCSSCNSGTSVQSLMSALSIPSLMVVLRWSCKL